MQRPNDPYLYLNVAGQWFCYNPSDQPLGSGAMGTVYLGYRCSDGSRVAIKRVNDTIANNPSIRARARQEASLAFRHSNLVEMIGCCEYSPEGGPMFLLSNFVEGEDIDKYIARFNVAADRTQRICNLICSVLDALDYIHYRGVIHRDIKPSNIMVDNDGVARLMDLGIARTGVNSQFTSQGFVGTLDYAAPEQIERSADNQVQINAATDIYQLGITFYELLAGENPMASDTEVDAMQNHLKKTLPPSKNIPKKLYKVILKATMKDQRDRFQTAKDFKLAIQQSLLPDPSLWQKIVKSVDDNPVIEWFRS